MGFKALTVNTAAEAAGHIYAEDDAAIFQSMFGGDGVLNIGNCLKSTVISNNKVRISDGVLSVGGHIGRLSHADYQDMTIENGATGYNRNDIIYARFLTSGNVDSFILAVKKGTATTGIATDPSLVQGNLYEGAVERDYPLYRVKLSGLSISSVDQLFTVIPTIPDLKAQMEKDKAEINQSLTIIKENLIPFPYCATSTGSYAKSFNSSSLTTVEAKNDGSLLIGSNGKIPSKTNQVLFRLIHDNFENIPLYNDIYSMDPHFENRPRASGVALAVSFERAKDSELETFYVTSPVEINNIDGKYTKIKYISVWLSTATASFENVKMKPTITRGGITEKRDVVSQKLSVDAIVARTINSLNIVHLPLKETKTLTLAQLYNSYAKQNDVLYVTVIDYSDSKSYKSSTMLLFIDDFQIYAISTEGLLKYDNVNDKWAVIIPRA